MIYKTDFEIWTKVYKSERERPELNCSQVGEHRNST